MLNYTRCMCRSFLRQATYASFRSNWGTFTANNAKTRNQQLCSPGVRSRIGVGTVNCTAILSWLGFKGDDEKQDTELVTTIKRAVYCWQNEQHDAAEQLLHVALRIAQQLQHQNGVLYCYDVMANLAMERHEYVKAEKLFTFLLREMLESKKYKVDDLETIHIAVKLARIAHLENRKKDAVMGYKWCLRSIKQRAGDDTLATKLVFATLEEWYSQFLSEIGRHDKVKEHLDNAYCMCKDVNGADAPQLMIIMNDMASVSFSIGDYVNARKYLARAINIGRQADDEKYLGVVLANYGVILAHCGIPDEAKEYCASAMQFGEGFHRDDVLAQANYCFEYVHNNEQTHTATNNSN